MNQLFDPAQPVQFWATVTASSVLGARLIIPALGAATRSAIASLKDLYTLALKSFAPALSVRLTEQAKHNRVKRAFLDAMPDWVAYKPQTGDVWLQPDIGNHLTIGEVAAYSKQAIWTITNADHQPVTGFTDVFGDPATLRATLRNGWIRKV